MKRRLERWSWVILMAAFIVVASSYALATPLFEASDELWHYPMVKTLADGNGLPVLDPANPGLWRQEAGQPPLYYWLMGMATRRVDSSDMEQVRWLNPHVDNGVITADGNTNLAIHSASEDWRKAEGWRGAKLAIRLVRLLSVLMSAGAVFLTYRLALELLPGETPLALASAAVMGFTPMFTFISGAVNNDNLAILLSTAILLVLVRVVKADLPPARLQHNLRLGLELAGLGALLGLAALTKESTLGLWALAGVVLVWRAYKRWRLEIGDSESPISTRSVQSPFRRLVLHVSLLASQSILVFGLAAVIAGWWYWRNRVLYGDWLGWSAFIGVLGQRAIPASLAQLWGERAGFMQSYWGLFGGVNVPMPNWIYAALNLLAVVGLAGLVRWIIGQWREGRRSPDRWMPFLLVAAWAALTVASLIRWTTITWSSQGRLVFSAIASFSIFLVIGVTAWLPKQKREAGAGFLAGGFFVLSALAPWLWILPRYQPPPEYSGMIPNRVDANFGGEMTLLGYEMKDTSAMPGGSFALTLYWRADIAMDRNWSVFVHLVGDHNIVVAQRDTYPGLGLLPTTLARPGQTWADRYVVNVPPGAYPANSARVEVGLYDRNDGTRLTLPDGRDAPVLVPLPLYSRPGDVPNPIGVNFGNQVQLAGYDVDTQLAHPADTVELTLYWRGLRSMKVNYSVFTHVRGEGESLWAQKDSWPREGAAPTSTWTSGALVEDVYQLKLRADTPPGVYDIEIGLYDGATGKRLQIHTPDGRWTDDFVYLAKVRVVPPSP